MKLKQLPYENYSVTENGRVWSHERMVEGREGRTYLHTGRWLKPMRKSTGRVAVGITTLPFKTKHGKWSITRTEYIARLVAMAFIRMPRKGEEITHKDGNFNNNHYKNLKWVSHSVNMKEHYKRKSNAKRKTKRPK